MTRFLLRALQLQATADARRSGRRIVLGLAIRSLVALIAIAGLSAAGLFAIRGMHTADVTIAASVDLAGRQRVLVKEIAFRAADLVNAEDDLRRSEARVRLRDALMAIVRKEQQLVRSEAVLPGDEAAHRARLRAYLAAAERLLASEVKALVPSHPDYRTIRGADHLALIAGFDKMIQHFGTIERDQRQRHVAAFDIMLWGQIALVLLTALIVFLPALKRTRDSLDQIADGQDMLRRLAQEAVRASNAKSEFLAHMSHELRTPLNAILGFSEVMKMEALGPMQNATYRDYAGHIHHSGTHLLNLINDILDLSRIEAGRVELEPEMLDAAESARDALRLVAIRGERAGLSLAVEAAPGLTIRADRRAVRQMLVNLLGNAVKFTPAGGQVTIFARRMEDGQIMMGVRDTGVGIDPADRERVLETFGQGRHDIATDKGTGLGLPIVRGLIEAHGGRITLESALGKGTIVTLWFPPAIDAEKALAEAQAESAAAA